MKKINVLLITIFVAICVFVPPDIFSLKKIVFIALILMNAQVFIFDEVENKKLIYFYGLVFSIVLLLYSMLITGDVVKSFTRGFVMFMILLVIIINKYKIDYEKILINIILVLAILVCLLALFHALRIINVDDNVITRFIYERGIGFTSASRLNPFYYKIFIKTTPLIVLTLFYSIKHKKKLMFGFSIVALLLSGTRANVLFPALFIAIIIIRSFVKNILQKRKTQAALILSLFMIFVVFYGTAIYNSITKIVTNDLSKTSDAIRVGHYESYKELVIKKPIILLTGTGLGSSYFSRGSGGYTSSIELSYLDLLRQMGLVFFIVFLVFIFYPVFFLSKEYIYEKYAYLSYLMIAATNPLLFSSTAYLLYIYVYLKINYREKIKESLYSRPVNQSKGDGQYRVVD